MLPSRCLSTLGQKAQEWLLTSRARSLALISKLARLKARLGHVGLMRRKCYN
jgi:hypothetical protein